MLHRGIQSQESSRQVGQHAGISLEDSICCRNAERNPHTYSARFEVKKKGPKWQCHYYEDKVPDEEWPGEQNDEWCEERTMQVFGDYQYYYAGVDKYGRKNDNKCGDSRGECWCCKRQ